MSHRVFNPKLGDSTEYTAKTAATVADIAESFHYVTYGVDKTNLLSLIKNVQSLFLGNIIGVRRTLN